MTPELSALYRANLHFANAQEQRHASYALTPEGTSYLESGSPEAQVFAAASAEGVPQAELLVCAAVYLRLALALGYDLLIMLAAVFYTPTSLL